MYHHAPLKQRVVSSTRREPLRSVSNVRDSYKKWNDDSMKNALEAVRKGESIRSAAIMYGVPRSTLFDYAAGNSKVGAGRSGGAYLTWEEEHELVSFILECASVGFPKTRKDVLSIVQNILESKGSTVTVSHGWMDRFQQHHPQLAMRNAVHLSRARAMASDPDTIRRYFTMLESCFKENGIEGPDQIYNCDETGLPLNPPMQKVIMARGTKHASHITGGDKSQITVLACTCATGIALPPFILMDRKSLNPACTHGEVPGTLYGLSQSGWMNQELFQSWFSKHFLQYIPPRRPIILLLDGHASHYCPETICLAAKNKVILFALPPNTTHLTQPLDRACFAPLKTAWKQECHHFLTSNPGKVVNRLEFSSIFAKAWYKAMKMENIIAGFKVTGIYPLDSRILLKDSYQQADSSSLEERTGLSFIPFLSSSSAQEDQRHPHQEAIKREDEDDWELSGLDNEVAHSFHHTEENDLDFASDSTVRYRYRTTISELLKPIPSLTDSDKQKSFNSAGTVLTSQENMKILEKKEKLKLAKEQEKAERQKAKMEKQKAKLEAKERMSKSIENHHQKSMSKKAAAQGMPKIFNFFNHTYIVNLI